MNNANGNFLNGNEQSTDVLNELTEKNESSHQRHNSNAMMEKLLLWVLVRPVSGVVKWNFCLDKAQNNNQT